MRRRRTRAFVFTAAAAMLAGTIALPAAPAGAAGEQLSAAPATSLLNDDIVQLTLSGASAYEGQQVFFAECNEPSIAAHGGGLGGSCGTESPQAGVTITNGTATYGLKVWYGPIPQGGGSAPSCTEANNGDCVIVATVYGQSASTDVATVPIAFAAPQTTALTATPSTNLDDGDTVAVSLTGIPNGVSEVDILLCHGDVPVTLNQTTSCKTKVYFGAVTNHAYSGSITVNYGPIFSGNTSPLRCDETASGHCAIAALDRTNYKVLGSTAISFEAPQTVMTVTPDTGLKDKQAVTVTVPGIPSTYQNLELVECNTTWTAAHGGYGATREGCDLPLDGDAYNSFDRTKANVVKVADGTAVGSQLEPLPYACNYATNGQCALVVLGNGEVAGGGYGYYEVASHPITFRPPVQGPVTITATPTTGLYDGAAGTLSATTIPDGVDYAELVECRPESIASFAGDWENRACAHLASIKVTDNAFAPQAIRYHEGGTGGTGVKPCDHTHPCEIGLTAGLPNGKDFLISNWIPISFRAPNFGTPTITLSKASGLESGDRVGLTVTDVPDLVRALNFSVCNVKGGYNAQRCRGVRAKPGDQGALIVHDNKTQGSTKIKAGPVGYRGGKKVFCNAQTNGQCVLVASTYPGSLYLITSSVIRFAKP